MAKGSINSAVDKVKWFAGEIKDHWRTPAEGKYVPYKEYKDVVIGVGQTIQVQKHLNT